MKPAILLLLALPSCIVPRTPERAPDPVPPQQPTITIQVRGGDQWQGAEPRRERQPVLEETFYQRRPVYAPEPLPYREPYPTPQPYTRPNYPPYVK